jgi:hypothetical protein
MQSIFFYITDSSVVKGYALSSKPMQQEYDEFGKPKKLYGESIVSTPVSSCVHVRMYVYMYAAGI